MCYFTIFRYSQGSSPSTGSHNRDFYLYSTHTIYIIAIIYRKEQNLISIASNSNRPMPTNNKWYLHSDLNDHVILKSIDRSIDLTFIYNFHIKLIKFKESKWSVIMWFTICVNRTKPQHNILLEKMIWRIYMYKYIYVQFIVRIWNALLVSYNSFLPFCTDGTATTARTAKRQNSHRSIHSIVFCSILKRTDGPSSQAGKRQKTRSELVLASLHTTATKQCHRSN